MDFSSAYLLVSHGSRDPRPQIALDHLAKLIRQRYSLESPSTGQHQARHQARQIPLIGTAVLELAPLPLHQQIEHFAVQAMEQGYGVVQIVPLFLLAGVHVMEDIPAEVNLAEQQFQGKIHLRQLPHLGSQARLWKLLLNPVDPLTTDPQSGKILLAHGSRRSQGNVGIEHLAKTLGALPAYWSIAPDLATQVTTLIKSGHQQLAILPYFLFEGGITDAIANQVEQLRHQFPYAQMHLGRPIGATPELAEQVIDLMNC